MRGNAKNASHWSILSEERYQSRATGFEQTSISGDFRKKGCFGCFGFLFRRAAFQHETQNLLRDGSIPHRGKRLAMERRWSVFAQSGEMMGRAVSLVGC